MLKIINCGINTFQKNIQNKTLILFGAGRRAKHICETLQLVNKVYVIIDNDKRLQGKNFVVDEKNIPIIGIEEFLEIIKTRPLEKFQLLITNAFYAWDIIQQLDNIECLNGMCCYDMNLLIDYYEPSSFSFCLEQQKIPKKIHYCWFGNATIPKHLQKCIDSWNVFCPEYEIIRWDENNYNITKNKYMKEAYENKKWEFVSDYVRLDIIYNEGGIYMDTDVELIASLNPLLGNNAFFGADNNLMINTGQGFGAVRHHNLIKELRDYYQDKAFIKEDGTLNLTPCYVYQHPVLQKYGFKIQNKYQKIDDIVIYPSEVSAPLGRTGLLQNFTEKTISIHHNSFSWINEDEKKHYEQYKKSIMNRIKLVTINEKI